VRVINIHEAGPLLAFSPIFGTSFSADGRRLALVTDLSSYVLNWKNGMYEEEGLSRAGPAELIALSADGKLLASAHHYGDALHSADGVECKVVDLDKGEKLADFQLSGTPTALGFAAGGKKVLAAILGRNLEVVDPATGRAEDTRISDYVLAISSDGRRVLARAGGSASKVAVAEISSGAKIASFDAGRQIATGTMSGDGRVVAVVDLDGKTQVWDLKESGEPVRISDPSPISAVGLNSDGSLLLTASQDQVQIRPWKVADLIKQACQMLTRPMTPEEWELYLREEPYRDTCAAQAGGKSK
jgi:WD40 repeat protein